jgi:methyltransferase (TIGR00027 family)
MPFKIGRFCATLLVMANENLIQHVSDTAIWVATFRARESEKKNPLFHDPLARRLAGDRGEKIAAQMPFSKRVEWTVILRTLLIDQMIKELIADGADTILNLGAGLDTRPYRMKLPATLRWIEVDYPHLIEYKETVLADEKPLCQLERVKLDLAQTEARAQLFARISAESKKVIVLTEGVTIYLPNEVVASLAQALRAHSNFSYWITDYLSPQLKSFFERNFRRMKLENSPFRFWPENWEKFYEDLGWKLQKMYYIGAEGQRRGLPPPFTGFMKWFYFFASAKKKKAINQMSGYAILESK